jgi:hypothetical protein
MIKLNADVNRRIRNDFLLLDSSVNLLVSELIFVWCTVEGVWWRAFANAARPMKEHLQTGCHRDPANQPFENMFTYELRGSGVQHTR